MIKECVICGKEFKTKNRGKRALTCDKNCGKEQEKIRRKKYREENKEHKKAYLQKYYKEHKEERNTYLQNKKIECYQLICDHLAETKGIPIPLKCMNPECAISNHLLLSVRHRPDAERFPDEYRKNGSQKPIDEVTKKRFNFHLERDDYLLYCMNCGQIHEYGYWQERLLKAGNKYKYTLQRLEKRINLLGGKCCWCDENRIEMLIAHHIYEDGNNDRKLLDLSEKRFQKLVEGKRLTIMCQNCHFIYHHILPKLIGYHSEADNSEDYLIKLDLQQIDFLSHLTKK